MNDETHFSDFIANQMAVYIYSDVMNKGAQAALPNWFARAWEMDVAVLNRSGYFQEYEIKVSRDDFLADFRNKKKKHILYESLKNTKHKLRHESEFSYVPSQFYYVCSEKVLHVKDIPAYAGLIYCDAEEGVSIVKKAPKIHAGKPDTALVAKFYRCMSWRLLNNIANDADIEIDKKFKIKRC